MLFKPEKADSAGLILTYKCTNSCAHCLYASSPSIESNCRIDTILKLIDSIKGAIPGCSLHIGGGEPLLEFDKLEKTIEFITGSGLHLEYVETNGLLLTGNNSKALLKKLKKKGLRCMLLSISPFHNQYITVQKNKKVFQNIVDIFGENGIFPWHPAYYSFLEKTGPDRTVPIKDYIQKFSDYDLFNQFNNIIYLHPAGRAAFLFADLFGKYPASDFLGKNCMRECSSPVHAHVDLSGNYCAGFCSGITIGQKSAFNLDKLYSEGIDLDKYPVLDNVIRKNLKALYSFTCEEGFRIDLDLSQYSSPCHFCLHMRTFLFIKYPGRFKELSPGFFYMEFKDSFGSYKL
ncbi:radical SAM protein [Elusimicrobiota bacterium]